MVNSYAIGSIHQRTRQRESLLYGAGLYLKQEHTFPSFNGYDNTYVYTQANVVQPSSLTDGIVYPQSSPYHVVSYGLNHPIQDNGFQPFLDYGYLDNSLYRGVGSFMSENVQCDRCNTLRVKCEFKTDRDCCERCLIDGYRCVVSWRTKNLAPLKRDLLNKIREQATQTQKLESQLDVANKGNSERLLTPGLLVASPGVSSPTQASAEPNGTSEREQNQAPLSSSPPPNESLHEILQSLLVTITELRAVQGPLVNDNTLLLFSELLNIPNATIVAGVETTDSDVELFLDFLLHVCSVFNVHTSSRTIRKTIFCEGSLQVAGDAKRKARMLMFKLVSKTNVLPRHLFITDVEKDPQAIAVGGFGRVFGGKHGGQLVALKMLYQSRRAGDSVEKNLCAEALAWRSLSHRFILPLLGIYEEGPQLFLVSPFMMNGALRDWRREHVPVQIGEIRRLLLEVAEGIQYIHSEGIVHGDLHGGNVLLDSELHCRITDFGSTRHCDVTVTRSTTTLAFNFAAPELFGMCTTCGELDCDELHDGEDEQHKIKTMKTDVYAFGCLYYAIFFDAVPFHGKRDFQIIRLVTHGVCPDRLENPTMEDFTWNLIQRCLKSKYSERPTTEEIVTELTPPAF